MLKPIELEGKGEPSQPPAGNRRAAAIALDPSSTIVDAEIWASEESAKTAQASPPSRASLREKGRSRRPPR
jgi:hypothetical protein